MLWSPFAYAKDWDRPLPESSPNQTIRAISHKNTGYGVALDWDQVRKSSSSSAEARRRTRLGRARARETESFFSADTPEPRTTRTARGKNSRPRSPRRCPSGEALFDSVPLREKREKGDERERERAPVEQAGGDRPGP